MPELTGDSLALSVWRETISIMVIARGRKLSIDVRLEFPLMTEAAINGRRQALIVACRWFLSWFVMTSMTGLPGKGTDIKGTTYTLDGLAGMDTGDIVDDVVRPVGIDAIAMAGLIGVRRSRDIIVGEVKLAAGGANKAADEAKGERTQRDLPMNLVTGGLIAHVVAQGGSQETQTKGRERGALMASGFVPGGAIMGVVASAVRRWGASRTGDNGWSAAKERARATGDPAAGRRTVARRRLGGPRALPDADDHDGADHAGGHQKRGDGPAGGQHQGARGDRRPHARQGHDPGAARHRDARLEVRGERPEEGGAHQPLFQPGAAAGEAPRGGDQEHRGGHAGQDQADGRQAAAHHAGGGQQPALRRGATDGAGGGP
ncbi:MAG: hypothetical protein R3D98_09755 [Candidatus Krumholzibacteriia bacterium]